MEKYNKLQRLKIDLFQKGRGKLFIGGGGGADDSRALDERFIQVLSRRKILYIPIGLQRDIVDYEDCYNWIHRTLSHYSKLPLDISMMICVREISFKKIRKFEAIYLGGAKNTYAFMKILKETNFDSTLIRFFSMGGIIYGGSAGAIILGKNISISNERPLPDYNLSSGLGLVGDFSIFCHYDNSNDQKEKIKNFLFHFKTPVLAIPEKSGIIVDERGQVEVVGSERIAIFKSPFRKTLIPVGKRFNI